MVFIVLCFEQVLRLSAGGLECQPAFVVRVRDAVSGDARGGQPILDLGDGCLGRGKVANDLFRRPVLAIVGGVWVGAELVLVGDNYERWQKLRVVLFHTQLVFLLRVQNFNALFLTRGILLHVLYIA